jgi:hypothetical protein
MKLSKTPKIILLVLAVLIAGTVLGIGSVAAGMAISTFGAGVENGAWTTNLAIGSQKADPYVRAAIAAFGLLALNTSETMYFSSDKDNTRARLNADCTYRIEGKAPNARWWSVTVYGADGYLIPDTERYSYSLTDLTPDANGVYTIYLSKTRHPGAWLSLGKESTFNLSLRLYNPGQSVRSNPGTVDLLRVIKEDCK